MQSTPIKINKPAANGNESAKPARNVLNLTPGAPLKAGAGNLKKYLWLLLVLVMVEGAALVWLYLLKPVSPYQRLLPPDAVAFSYFNQTTLINLIKTQGKTEPIWPWLAWSESALKGFLAQAKITQPEQLLAAFADQMALAILPQETNARPTWLILASVKAPNDIFSQSRDKTEQALKQNFNVIGEPYRQIKISQIQPLSQDKNNFFYAEANGYFILTNNGSLIKETIDKIIK